MGMQSKGHPTHKTDRLMAMACLELQRPGRVRWFVSHHPHTVLALVLVCAVGVFAPGVASAQDATIADGTHQHQREYRVWMMGDKPSDAAGPLQLKTRHCQ